MIKGVENKSKIFSNKFVRNKKANYLCTPLEWMFIERLGKECEENEKREF
jgi:hypothetical protein